jgi:hypothetical protein
MLCEYPLSVAADANIKPNSIRIMKTNTLRFAWITNNGYDTLAIVDASETVVSQWTMTEAVAKEYKANSDASDWDLNYPEDQSISDYGTEVTGDNLSARLEFFIR